MVDADTIIAVATPPGPALRGIIRLSGPLSFSVINQRFLPDQPLSGSLRGLPHYSSSSGYLKLKSYDIKIPVGLYLMKAPYSYTKEDVVEVHTFGSAPLLELITEELTHNTNVRLAQPGEFTQRAFLNGRIDLAQAESVLAIIKSRNEQSFKNAFNQLQGGFSDKINIIQQQLIDLVANLEAALDFSDQDIQLINRPEAGQRLRQIQDRLRQLLKDGRSNRVFQYGTKAVLCGRPNVGKSSLFNRLVPDKKVIVTAIPGTTRDVVEGLIKSGENQVRMYDTAGLFNTRQHTARPPLEQKIRRQTQRFLESNDINILVVDGSRKITRQDKEVLRGLHVRHTILVLNKSDLKTSASVAEIKQALSYKTGPVILTSARTGRGIKQLKNTVFKLARSVDRVAGDFYLNTRHQLALDNALEELARADSGLTKHLGYELISLDLKEALGSLNEITGKTYTEDILDRIFSQFCIGK